MWPVLAHYVKLRYTGCIINRGTNFLRWWTTSIEDFIIENVMENRWQKYKKRKNTRQILPGKRLLHINTNYEQFSRRFKFRKL